MLWPRSATDAVPPAVAARPQLVERERFRGRITLVGLAGVCAYGPGFVPPRRADDASFALLDTITVQVRTLGWPRTVELPLPFRLAEPMASSP